MTTHDWQVVAATLAITLFAGLGLTCVWTLAGNAVRRWRAKRRLSQMFPAARTSTEQGLALINAVVRPHDLYFSTQPPPRRLDAEEHRVPAAPRS